MNESLLKKEFKESDLQRARNLANKDYTSKTKLGVGYRKNNKRHKEGDVCESNGKTWTIKNGLKQNITKLDSAKKACAKAILNVDNLFLFSAHCCEPLLPIILYLDEISASLAILSAAFLSLLSFAIIKLPVLSTLKP